MRKSILGVVIDDISFADALTRVRRRLSGRQSESPGGPFLIFTPGPEFLVTAWQDKEFQGILNSADLSLPDGYGLKIFAGIRNVIPGVDFMRALCREAAENGWTVGLFGGEEEVAHRTASELIKQYPKVKIPLIVDGAAADEVLSDLSHLRRLKPVDILFVALGHPKQEKFLWALSRKFRIENCCKARILRKAHNFKLKIRVGMGVGGSFDFISGQRKEPPAWLGGMGLKWLGRLILRSP